MILLIWKKRYIKYKYIWIQGLNPLFSLCNEIYLIIRIIVPFIVICIFGKCVGHLDITYYSKKKGGVMVAQCLRLRTTQASAVSVRKM